MSNLNKLQFQGMAAALAVAAMVMSACAMAQTSAAPPPAASAERPGPMTPEQITITRADPALDALLPKTAKVEVFASGFRGTEGPLWTDGKLYISDQSNGDWWAIAWSGERTLLGKLVGGPINPEYRFNQGPNAAIPWRSGGMLVMRQGLRDIGLYKNGKFSSFVSGFEGKRFNAPNDGVVGKDGALWFTDPTFSLPGGVGSPLQETPFAGVYRLGKNGKLTVVDKEMKLPNGIGLSPDEKTLYVSDSADPGLWAYDVAKDGTVSNKRVFIHWGRDPNIRGSVDGLKVDAKGNVWATSPGGVSIVTPQGKELGRIVFASHTSNVAFGGPDGKTLFITNAGTVYKAPTLVRGETLMYAR
jgi:gluconolactonase